MKKILKKAKLINTVADSVVVIMLVEKNVEKMKAYIIETHLFNCKGEKISESTKIYTTYRTAAEKYSFLIGILS